MPGRLLLAGGKVSFPDKIQVDGAWRKRELVALKGALVDIEAPGPQLRSAVVMAYAHWEGFVKTACDLYIAHINEMIARRKIQLSPHFADLLRWKMFRQEGSHPYLRNPEPFLRACREWPCQPDELFPQNVIETESNLSSSVLRRILIIVDLDYGAFETKQKLIDERLLKLRNKIAHGERVQIDRKEYEEIEHEVRALDAFQTQIENSVQQQTCRVRTEQVDVAPQSSA